VVVETVVVEVFVVDTAVVDVVEVAAVDDVVEVLLQEENTILNTSKKLIPSQMTFLFIFPPYVIYLERTDNTQYSV